MSAEDIEDILPDEPEERAFRRSGQGYQFRGKQLESFSHLRKTAAAALGLKYWKLTREDVDESSAVYNEIVQDAAIVLWLCNASKEMCKRARSRPRLFEDVIDEWAEKEQLFEPGGIIPDSEALDVFMAIMSDVDASSFVPDAKGEPAKN